MTVDKDVNENDETYAIEVKFTNDGTLLNVTNPHLIVIQRRNN